MAWGWKLVHGGRTPPPGAVVAPDERLSWPRMVAFGGQHVIAMFGATFVFPLVMGLDPNLAIMMSGVATILFLLITQNRIPSYLGTSASFVGAVVAIRALDGSSDATVTGAILVAGLVLAVAGVVISVLGVQVISRVFPPVVTGGVVMLIGFGLAYVVADTYWPADPWIALITMLALFVFTVRLPGFWGRIGILLALVVGYVLSWVFDRVFGELTTINQFNGLVEEPHLRTSFTAVRDAAWFGLPDFHGPKLSGAAILLCLPAVIALIAENTGHVKAVAEMTGRDLDPHIGRAIMADGVGTAVATSVGGSPTTTYAENIGVMAATRIYSTAAYYVAALVAILFGLCPKFGALVANTPYGALAGITVVLYGMIGLLGAKIWVENRVDLANPINLVPVAAGLVLAIGPVTHPVTDDFELAGIALGTVVVLVGWHLLRVLAPAHMRTGLSAGGRGIAVTAPGADAVAGGTPAPGGAPAPGGRNRRRRP